MRCPQAVERLDAELVALASVEAGLRLRLGQALEVLSRGGHFELGFSSMAAYALERCERSVRWVEAACCLARRLEALPLLRRAVAWGRVSWSMGELLARVARPTDEARWIDFAQGRAVRQLRQLVRAALADERRNGDTSSDERLSDERAAASAASESEAEGEDMCTLHCTVDQEEAWLLEATRTLLEHLGVRGSGAQLEALLAEGQGTLLASLPEGALDASRWEAADAAQRRWLAELSRWRDEAEALCEGRLLGAALGRARAEPGSVGMAAALGLGSLEGTSPHELDGTVRALSRSLARHELELARLVLAFHRAAFGEGGWRRLGYATEGQYARERLGMSRSSWLGRRALGLRLEALPYVAGALGTGELGVEAALQLVRIATPATEVAWVERARQRTVKHLREEVAAALAAVRLSGEADCPPPAEVEMDGFHELERAVVSGRACRNGAATADQLAQHPVFVRSTECAGAADHRDTADGAGLRGRQVWSVMLGSLARWLEQGVQTSAGGAGRPVSGARCSQGHPSAGRVALRLRVSRSIHTWWRGLEAQARRWLPRGMSWLKFLCMSLWQAWRHLIGGDVGSDIAYGQIYIRDRWRCTSPVCNRQDVTPHHIQFRSAGGSDSDDNVAAVCSWCHLFGVHGGRIRAAGTARRIRWELGGSEHPCLVVDGRQRMAA